MSDFLAKESLTLEETNRVRISLGLKPLAEDDGGDGGAGDGEADAEAVAEANFAAMQDEAAAARRTAELKSKLDRHANQRALNAKLAGRTLGDLDPEGDVDASSWVKAAKKRTKKAQAELAANADREKADAAALLARGYDASDLRGLKVGHDADDFGEGEQHVLVLKDSRIEDDEDDELTNVRMADLDRTKDRLDLKEKAKQAAYTGYDDEEFNADGTPRQTGLLSKYDEDAEKESGFVLGDAAAGGDADMADAPRRSRAKDVDVDKRTLLSLDYTKNLDVSDYLVAGDKGFKKPKKKRAKAAARQIDAEDAIGPAPVERTSASELREQAMRDDEDLQAALARERVKKSRAKLGSARRRALEDDTINLPDPAETADSPAPQIKQEEDEPAGIEFDDMTEFVRNIRSAREAAADAEAEGARSSMPIRRAKSETLEAGDQPVLELENREPEDGEVGDEAPYDGDEAAAMDVDGEDETKPDVKAEEVEYDPITQGTSNELTYGRGLAAAFKMVKQQGLLKELTDEDRQRDAESRAKARWLAERRAEERAMEIERQRMREAGSSISQAERERINRERERNRAQSEMDAFKDYKPNIAINYFDDHGRQMNVKEQWKTICHHFHGKGSGHAKEEKRLKRIADEQRREAIASGDTPTGTTAAFLARQERTGSATMVLAVGNNNAAPMPTGEASSSASRHLAANKGARTVKSKGKAKLEDVVAGTASAAPSQGLETPMVNLTPTIGQAAPKPKAAGFARIAPKAPSEAKEATPAPVRPPAPIAGSGIKIALKRANDGDLPGSPAEKRGRAD